MAVPTALPIELSSVCLEIYGSTNTLGKTLQTCFSVANGTFDPTYEGSKDRLTNFRGYSKSVAPTIFPLTILNTVTTDTLHYFKVENDNATLTSITIRFTLVSLSSAAGYARVNSTNLTVVGQTKDVSHTSIGSTSDSVEFLGGVLGDTASVKGEVISSTLSGTLPSTPASITMALENTTPLTLITTSNSVSWSPFEIVNVSTVLNWEATGAVTQTIVADDPTFDFSSNVGNANINMWIYPTNGANTFDIRNLEITFIDCFNFGATLNLNVSNNLLTTLDTTMVVNLLETLYCHTNSLTSLNVSNSTALEFLFCYDNNLTTLDLSSNTELIRIDCGQNLFITLDLSNNTKLQQLDLNGSLLTSINLSTNTSLRTIYIYDSTISSLVLTNNPICRTILAQNSALTTLDLTPVTQPFDIRCNGNNFSSTTTNSILANCVSGGATEGRLDCRDNATGQGIIDLATLISRSWTVNEFTT